MSSPTESKFEDNSEPLLRASPSRFRSPDVQPRASISTVKITPWRAINSAVILTFGTTKAVLAFKDNRTADAFDMGLGLIWAFVAYWCSILEAECPGIAPWLFEVDITHLVMSFSLLLAIVPLSLPVILMVERALVFRSSFSSPVISWLILIPSTMLVGMLMGLVIMVLWSIYLVCIQEGIWTRLRRNWPSSIPLSSLDWSLVHHFQVLMSGQGIYAYMILVLAMWYITIEGLETTLGVSHMLGSQNVAMALTLVAAMCAIYILTGVSLTARRCFRNWRRDRAERAGDSVEMVNRGPV